MWGRRSPNGKQLFPDTGEIIWMDFDPQAGREQRKRRPALVLTDSKYNRASGLCVVCPITSARKGYPFEVPALVDKVEALSSPIR